jgi:arylformamidase
MIIHDISAPLYNGMPCFPGDPEPQITRLQDHTRGDPWTTSHLNLCAHTGTHVDAPRHRIRGGGTVDTLELSTLLGPAYVADFAGVERVITERDLETAEIPRDAQRLLLKTRNGALWERRGFQTDFVALGKEAAEWVVAHGVRLVALDYLSADVYAAQEYPAHTVLLGAGIVIVEGIQLEKIEAGWYTLICLPLNVAGADGAPARAILISGTRSFPIEEEK